MPVDFYDCPEHPEGCAHKQRGLACRKCGKDGFANVLGLLAHALEAHRTAPVAG